jgi:hypothetical protein
MSYLDDWIDDRDERREQRLRQLGTRSPRCRGCPETDTFALSGVHPDIVCYECLAIEQGRSPIEGHHVSGRANDPDDVIDLPGNDHRPVSAAQLRWPAETLRNPDGSPALRAAAAIRGWLEVLALIMDRTVGWVPRFLEWLDGALRTAIGPAWWTTLGWEG